MKKSYLIVIIVVLALVAGYCLYKHKAHEHPGEAVSEHPGTTTTETQPAAPETSAEPETPAPEAPTQ